jgi:hypothetical protein
MPVGPNGEQLPYPDEPGYEEAMATYPEAYAEEGGGMASAAPGGAEQMTDEEYGQRAVEAENMEVQAVVGVPPEPEEPYTAKALSGVVGAINSVIDKFGGGALPSVGFELPDGERHLNSSLPVEIYAPLVGIINAVSAVDAEGKFEDLLFDPETLVDNTSLTMAAGKLTQMTRNAELGELLTEPASAPTEEGETMAEEPEPLSEEEEAVFAGRV